MGVPGTNCELSLAGVRAAELRWQWRHGSAWQKCSRNRNEAPTPGDRESLVLAM